MKLEPITLTLTDPRADVMVIFILQFQTWIRNPVNLFTSFVVAMERRKRRERRYSVRKGDREVVWDG